MQKLALIMAILGVAASTPAQDPSGWLATLPQTKDYVQHRSSSYDRTGGNEDYRQVAPGESLTLLDALHQRWVTLLKALGPADLARTFVHPETGSWTIGRYVAPYSWHGKHHVAHITSLRQRMGW